jgi:hypothetical protein
MSTSLIEIFQREARATIEEWLRRWSEENGDAIRVRYFEDGTAEIERETDAGFEQVRLTFGVAAVEVRPNEPNVPVGPEYLTPWEEIPAGSFIKAPNGQWYEIAASKDVGKMQHVTLRDTNGKEGGFPRMKRQEVTMRAGSRNAELTKALDALRFAWAVEVVNDEVPPWDE